MSDLKNNFDPETEIPLAPSVLSRHFLEANIKHRKDFLVLDEEQSNLLFEVDHIVKLEVRSLSADEFLKIQSKHNQRPNVVKLIEKITKSNLSTSDTAMEILNLMNLGNDSLPPSARVQRDIVQQGLTVPKLDFKQVDRLFLVTPAVATNLFHLISNLSDRGALLEEPTDNGELQGKP